MSEVDTLYDWFMSYSWWTHFKETVDWGSKLASITISLGASILGYRTFSNWLEQKKVDKHVELATQIIEQYDIIRNAIITLKTDGTIARLLVMDESDLDFIGDKYQKFRDVFSVINIDYNKLKNTTDKSVLLGGINFETEVKKVSALIDHYILLYWIN